MYSPFIHSSSFTHQSHSLTQDHMETTWPMYKPACALGLVEYVPGLKALPELTRSTISSLAPGLSRNVVCHHFTCFFLLLLQWMMAWHIPHQKANTSRGVQSVIFDMTCVLQVPYVLGGIYVCRFLPLSLLCSLCREEEAVHRHSIPSRTAMLPFIRPIATSQRRSSRRRRRSSSWAS